MKFSEVFEKLLNDSDENLKETIAKSITDKASSGDINAIKFLKDMVEVEDDGPQEIKITVID